MLGAQAPAPAPTKKVANIDANQAATQQRAIPALYIAGKRRVPFHFIAPPYNHRTEPIKEKTGKDQSSTVGTNHFGDIAAVLCCPGELCPVSKLHALIKESVVVWTGPLTADSDPYEPVTVADFGSFRIFWGTMTQPVDTTVLTPIGPPPDPTMYPDFNPRIPSTWPNGDQTTQLP